jgi:hypothetical protein
LGYRNAEADEASDSEEEFLATTDAAIAAAKAHETADESKAKSRSAKKYYFRAPEWALSEGVSNDDLSCRILLVSTCIASSAYLSHALSAPSTGFSLRSLGSVTYHARSSGPASVALSAVLSATGVATDVILALPSARVATEFAGPLAHVLLGGPLPAAASASGSVSAAAAPRVSAAAVIALSSLPYTTFTPAPVARPAAPAFLAAVAAAAAAAAGTADASAPAPMSVVKTLKAAPLAAVESPAFPPLLYTVLSPAASTALASTAGATDAAAESVSTATNAAVPFLPPPNVLFGFDAALLSQCAALRVPCALYASVDNAHHYAGETLLAWERAASAAATVAAAAGAGDNAVAALRAALRPASDAFAAPASGASGAAATAGAGGVAVRAPSELTRVREYRAWRAAAEAAAPRLSLANRDVGEHKYARFANKDIPHGIFA